MTKIALIAARLWRGGQAGQSLVFVALSLFAVIAITGLAIDTGQVLQARRELIAVSDSAALAAAGALSGNPSLTDIQRQERAQLRATQYAEMNGFSVAAEGHSMTVAFPASTPARKVVQVEASRPVDMSFMRILGINQVTVSSGSRAAEAAPLDVVIVQDVSESQRSYTHCNEDDEMLIKPTWAGSRIACSVVPTAYKCGPLAGYAYDPTNATNVTWPSTGCPSIAINVPWVPFAREQWAARYFVDHLDSRYDKVGLVSFSGGKSSEGYDVPEASVHATLTSDYATVKNKIGYSPETQGETGIAGLYPDGKTNIAAGINIGVSVLTDDANARPTAVGAMILLSDGSATVRASGVQPSGCSSSSPENCSLPRKDAMDAATAAMNKGIVIYTIYVGTDEFEEDDGLLMQWIADLTDNRHLDGDYAGTRALPTGYGPVMRPYPSENYYRAYTQDELQAAYESILEKVYTRLVQ